MNLTKTLVSSFILSATVVSCTERIDLPLDESSIRLVVDGAITNTPAVHRFYLSKTTDYYYNQEPPKVTGAIVSISDGIKVFLLTEEIPGVYQTTSDFQGVEGSTYTLNIKLTTPIGGFTEYTATSTMPRATVIDSVNLAFYPEFGEEGIWEVRCYMYDPPTSDYYRFLVSRNEQMLTDTLNEWFVTDDRFFNGTYTFGTAIYYLDQSLVDERLVTGDRVTVELNTLSKEYNSFLSEAQIELQGSDPLFSGPPANIKGNISHDAIGFFAAYTVSRAFVIAESPE
jgi:hypothetical protein